MRWLQERHVAEKRAGFLAQRVELLERECARLESFLQGAAAAHRGPVLERAGKMEGGAATRGLIDLGVEVEDRQVTTVVNQLLTY